MQDLELKNRLGQETSPYLLQHKDNPVHWFSWGPEAFAAAKKLHRPIFLSIGYSTCYWCHVMEGDSFEKENVAAVLNQHFICIKVDREERPDIDKIFMDAVMAISGHGGWPLSAFLTPEGEPFFAATFFWQAQFLDLLKRISELWQSEQEKFLTSAAEITAHLNKINTEKSESSKLPESSSLEEFIKSSKNYFDVRDGGFGQAPKFPQAERLALLLRLSKRFENEDALRIVKESLDAMAQGGLYDHIGGGFHRYSVDEKWLVPHFEKMLYDNALLSSLYGDAFLATKQPSYRVIATETLNYLLAEMQDHAGAFYAAQDAGAVGEEGLYYTWPEDELKKLLSEKQFASFSKLYQISETGNFEERNIPRLVEGSAALDKLNSEQQEIREILYKKRCQRERPHRDQKILADWNGLAVTAFAKGYRAFKDVRYLQAAESAAEFVYETLLNSNHLSRSYCAGQVKHRAVLSDYVYLIEGFLSLYQASWDVKWYERALELQAVQDNLLWDPSGAYFYAESSSEVSVFDRSKEFADGATPAGNAVALQNLLNFYYLSPKLEYKVKAEQILSLSTKQIAKHPFGYAGLLIGLDSLLAEVKQLVVVGPRDDLVVQEVREFLDNNYLPHLVAPWSDGQAKLPDIVKDKTTQDGKAAFYVCNEKGCREPVTSLEELIPSVM